MAQLNKTLHIKKGGTEQTAKLYTTTAETGGTYGFLKVDGQQAYYALGASSDGRATYGRVRKNNKEYAILNSGQIPYHKDNYTTPGTYSWTCPQGVTRVKVTVAGAGGGGAVIATMGRFYGGNGELIIKTVNSIPLQAYSVIVGEGGVSKNGFEVTAPSGGSSSALGVSARGGGGAHGTTSGASNGTSYGSGGKGGEPGTTAEAKRGGNGWVYIEYGGDI